MFRSKRCITACVCWFSSHSLGFPFELLRLVCQEFPFGRVCWASNRYQSIWKLWHLSVRRNGCLAIHIFTDSKPFCACLFLLCVLSSRIFSSNIVTEIFGNASLVFWEWLSSQDLQSRLFSNLPKLNCCLLEIGSDRLSYSKIFKKASSADHCLSILFQPKSLLLATVHIRKRMLPEFLFWVLALFASNVE